MKYLVLSISLLALTSMTGCQNNDNKGLSENFGNAIYHNEAAQIIPPKYASDRNTSIQGDRGAVVFERYKTGNTIQPSTSSTSSLSSSGD